MKLNISGPLKVSLALIVVTSLTTFGIMANANVKSASEPVAAEVQVTDGVQEVQDMLTHEYQERTGVSAKLAKDILDDQGKLAVEIVPALGIEDRVNADIWLEPIEGGQAINVRTQDEKIIAGLLKQEFAASKVIIYREPVIAKTVPDIDSDEIRKAIESVVPNHQGLAVRVQDGALELYVMKELSTADIELLKERTGFSKVELFLMDEPFQVR